MEKKFPGRYNHNESFTMEKKFPGRYFMQNHNVKQPGIFSVEVLENLRGNTDSELVGMLSINLLIQQVQGKKKTETASTGFSDHIIILLVCHLY